MSDRPPQIRRARPNLIGQDELMGWTEQIVALTERFEVVSTVLDIVDAAMYNPATWLKQIDR